MTHLLMASKSREAPNSLAPYTLAEAASRQPVSPEQYAVVQKELNECYPAFKEKMLGRLGREFRNGFQFSFLLLTRNS